MSIYSGFATRSLESAYNKYLSDLLNLFQSYLLNYLRKGKIYLDSRDKSHFVKYFVKILANLKSLEQQKHLKPMFSTYCNDLAEFVQSCQDFKLDSPTIQDPKLAAFTNDYDFQILTDGLAYDDNRVQRFTPSRLEVVVEKPKTRNFSREKTQKYIYLRSAPLENVKLKFINNKKKKLKNISNACIYQNRAFTKIDHEISF